MVKSFNDGNLGALKAVLSEHMFSQEVEGELERYPTQTIIGLGQGGGRIAAELSRFGHPTILLNSSKSDMDEHRHLIDEKNRIVTDSKNYPELEGTDKNAELGHDIALENRQKYMNVAVSAEVQDAEFVWVTVSLGGGTGNGALMVALSYLSRAREKRALPNGDIPLGVICSLPSKDEKGLAFRRNTLAGIKLLQQFINERKIGSVLVIDNEKMSDYYATEPLRTYAGTEIDAKSYSNMVVASLLAEVSVLPLFHGRSVFDKTELLSTLSTPGWLSISRNNKLADDDNLEVIIEDLFTKNEILANYNIEGSLAGAIGVIYPSGKNISPRIADDVYHYTSSLLNSKVNLAITNNSTIKNLTLYGMTVLPRPSIRISEIMEEFQKWQEIEKQQEKIKREAAAALDLEGFDIYSSPGPQTERRRATLDDLDDDFFGLESNQNEKKKNKDKDDLSLNDINFDDIEF